MSSKPQNDAVPGQAAPGSDRTLAVVDPDDYIQNRRLRQIFDAKDRLPETVREESSNVGDGGITYDRYQELLADAVVMFLAEVEPLILDPRFNDLNPVAELRSLLDDEHDVDELEGVGAGVYLWDHKDVSDDSVDEKITISEIVENIGYPIPDMDQPISERVSWRTWRETGKLLRKAGIGVELDEGLPWERGFDASRTSADVDVEESDSHVGNGEVDEEDSDDDDDPDPVPAEVDS